MEASAYILLGSGVLAMLPFISAFARGGRAAIPWKIAAGGTGEPLLFSVLISLSLSFFDFATAVSFLSGAFISLLTALACRRLLVSQTHEEKEKIKAPLAAFALAFGPALSTLGAVIFVYEGNACAAAGAAGGWAGALYLKSRLALRKRKTDQLPESVLRVADSTLHRSADVMVIAAAADVLAVGMESGESAWMMLPAALLAPGVLAANSALLVPGLVQSRKKKGEWVVWFNGIAVCAAAYFISKILIAGFRSTDLWMAGIMDRTGPFWAVAVGIFMPLLARQAVRHYRRHPAAGGHLFFKTERILLPSFFICAAIGFAYIFAGLYGIALAGIGFIAVPAAFPDEEDNAAPVAGSLFSAAAALAACAALAGVPLSSFLISFPEYFFTMIPAGAVMVLVVCAFRKRFPSDRREAYPSLCLLSLALYLASIGLDTEALSGFFIGMVLTAVPAGFRVTGSADKIPDFPFRAALDCGSLLRASAAFAATLLLVAAGCG